MIIEQIRYYASAQDREQLLLARRVVSQVRSRSGLPPGHILLADSDVDEGPSVVWQCSYEDETQMSSVEVALIGDPDYEAARERVGALASRVELELYTYIGEEVPSTELRADA
jgi:hypothetical protein